MPLPTEQAALLRAIVATPDDDTPRLVYADWLEENAQRPQAQFIRDSIRLARAPDQKKARHDLKFLHAVADEHQRDWLADLGLHEATARYDRGFPRKVTFRGAGQFLDSVDGLTRFVPLTSLEIVSASGDSFLDDTLGELAALPVLARLDELWLLDHRLAGWDVWEELFHSPHVRGLRLLSVAGCEFSESEVESLAGSPALANLKQLDLSYNSIGAEGLQLILDSPHLTKLTDLWLEHNFFGDDALEDELLEQLEARLGEGLHTHESPEGRAWYGDEY